MKTLKKIAFIFILCTSLTPLWGAGGQILQGHGGSIARAGWGRPNSRTAERRGRKGIAEDAKNSKMKLPRSPL